MFVAHRINTINELKRVDKIYGVEIDVRDLGNELLLVHDPFIDVYQNHCRLEDFLGHYDNTFLIVNVKSERIETRIINLLAKFGVANYFFLDSSFPMIYSLSQRGVKNFALRFSEFESLESVLAMSGKVDWVWVDCFTSFPLDAKTYTQLKTHGFKICCVSPELQGQREKIEVYRDFMDNNNIQPDLICTKVYNIEQWKTRTISK